MESDKAHDSHQGSMQAWESSRFQVVSLLEMLKHYASEFYALGSLLKGIHAEAIFHPHNEPSVDKKQIERIKEFCVLISLHCDKIGLNLSVKAANRLAEQLSKNPTYDYLRIAIPELEQRIEDELASVLFLYVPSNKSEYYTNSGIFGASVTGRFPSAILDIEEAGKCYALGRYTASVMHLMRVIEIGLRSVAKGLGIPEAQLLPTWQAVISKIESEMRTAANKRGPDWLKIEPFYREIPAHLFAIKNAWRNPSMHVQTSYDEERAFDIYNAVRGFMRYLATELSE